MSRRTLNASVDINWYIARAQEAEAAKFDLVFIVDSQFITANSPTLPGISLVIAGTDEEARAKEDARLGGKSFDRALKELGRPFGWHDFTRYDLDALLPRRRPPRAEELPDAGERDRETGRGQRVHAPPGRRAPA